MFRDFVTFSLLTETDHATVAQGAAGGRVLSSQRPVDQPLRHRRVDQSGHGWRLSQRPWWRCRVLDGTVPERLHLLFLSLVP